MTSKAQIIKVASKDGVDARVVERDYVLAHIVALISSHDVDARLAFKGGISLRLHSADLGSCLRFLAATLLVIPVV